MFNRWTINFGTGKLSNGQLLIYASHVAQLMDGNLNYSGIVPTIVDVNSAITTYSNALTAFGVAGNRGSKIQKDALDVARAALEQILAELAWACQVMTPFSKSAFLSGGWDVKSEPMPVGMLPAVQNLEQVKVVTIPSGAVKLRWKRPPTVKPGNVGSYIVLNSLTADVNAATVIATIMQTSYTDLDAGSRPSNFYWVIPVGTAGKGTVSDVVVGYPQGPVIA